MAGTQVEPGVREQQASIALVLQAAWRRAGRTDFLSTALNMGKRETCWYLQSVRIYWLAILSARLVFSALVGYLDQSLQLSEHVK